jgi:hypothetical protein
MSWQDETVGLIKTLLSWLLAIIVIGLLIRILFAVAGI